MILVVGLFGCEDDIQSFTDNYKCGDDSTYRTTQDSSTVTYEFGENGCNTIKSFMIRDRVYLLDNPDELDLIKATKTVRGVGYSNKSIEIYYFDDFLKFNVDTIASFQGSMVKYKYKYKYGDNFISKEHNLYGTFDYIYDFEYLFDYLLEDVAYDVVFLEATEAANLL